MIEFTHVSKDFGSGEKMVRAVRDVSLTIQDGEIFGIIGFSGAGKSTLVRCINLLERPTNGTVVVDGKEMTALSPKELRLARRKIGMIFQHFNLMPSRTVFGNVAYPLQGQGLSKQAIQNKVRKLLKLVDIADKETAYPSQLSGGQKQRVAIARALVNDPDLVLLDLTLPVKDGQHICHEVRRESEVPIIVLTSRTTEIDEVMAMTLGADDFVPKPYSARVLVARINALLRRTAAAGERSTLVHKGLELDLARSMVTNTQTGTSTELTKNELRILSLLLSRAGKIVSRSAIMQDLWDSDAFVDDNTLTVNINRLRTTLEKIGIKGYLTTHRGQGYSV